MNEAGKGDSPRPYSVSLDKFKENFDKIFGKKSETEKPCKECNGSGKIIKGNQNASFDDFCPICSGKGNVK
jgi:DnaJ-class molecular chaperone